MIVLGGIFAKIGAERLDVLLLDLQPAAAACPPCVSRCVEQAVSACADSKPGMLRPEPMPGFTPNSSSAIITTGR